MSLILLAATAFLAIGTGACSLNIPAEPDLASPPPDSAGAADMSAAADMTETGDAGN